MNLTECFMEIFTYVMYFLKTYEQRQPSFEEVRKNIERLLKASEECAYNKGITPQDYNEARFAVCAWIDEAILNSGWQQKVHWQKELLQKVFYRTTNAGEEFFEHLNALEYQKRDVREIYYLCLALGFSGRYSQEEDKYLLEQLKASNLKLLLETPLEVPVIKGELFPYAYPPPSQEVTEEKIQTSPLFFILIAAPIVLLVLLYIIYQFVLNGVGKSLLNLMS